MLDVFQGARTICKIIECSLKSLACEQKKEKDNHLSSLDSQWRVELILLFIN